MSIVCTDERSLLASPRVNTPLTATSLFGTVPMQFSKAFLKKMHTPPLSSIAFFNIDNKKCLLNTKSIRMISAESCGTKNWSNDCWKFSLSNWRCFLIVTFRLKHLFSGSDDKYRTVVLLMTRKRTQMNVWVCAQKSASSLTLCPGLCNAPWMNWRSTKSSMIITWGSRRCWTSTSSFRRSRSCETSSTRPKWLKKLNSVRLHVLPFNSSHTVSVTQTHKLKIVQYTG